MPNVLAHGVPVIIAGATEDKMAVVARIKHSGAKSNLRKQRSSASDIKNAVSCIFAPPPVFK